MFKRRDFFRTSFGALFVSALPSFAKAPEASKEQRGMALRMSSISDGPFLSIRSVFRYHKPDYENTEHLIFPVVKIAGKDYWFDQPVGFTQSLYNAEEFMQRLGYKVWIATEDVFQFKRPENDKEFRINAKKFGDALDRLRDK